MIKDYYRFSKPGIVYANVLMAAAGFLLAAKGVNWSKLIFTLVGFALVVAGACALNNLHDRSIDKVMERTKKRPSVTGAITLRNGLVFAALITAFGLLLLLFTTTAECALVALMGWAIYVGPYTILKTKTVYATLIGAISGAMPVVGGYLALRGFNLECLLAGALMMIWQMPHFYAIAIYRRQDYEQAGVPVLSVANSSKRAMRSIIGYSLVFAALCVWFALSTPLSPLSKALIYLSSFGWLAFNLKGLKASSLESWSKQSFACSLVVVVLLSASFMLA